MFFNIPFYIQGVNECGPVTLQMVLEFLGEKHDKEEIKQLIDSFSTGATMTIGLANAAAKLGFKTEFFSACLGFNPDHIALEYYKQLTDGAKSEEEIVNLLREECAKNGVIMKEESLTLNEITEKISEKCAAFILLDWGKVRKTESYIGHFVPIVGFDENNVYIHQPGSPATANQPLPRELFEIARKAKGTDEDIVFIHRKQAIS